MNFEELKKNLAGEFHTEETIRYIYATDASVYREVPWAVAIPRSDEDIKKLIHFSRENKTSLIPRTAGTSLTGQVVGDGIVVDVSKYFTNIIEVNIAEEYVWVQPGVVRDELNRSLAKYGYFFAPETSTANRAMIGGMIGNNSCGTNSIVYGSVREHLLEVKGLLSDGSEAHFKENCDLRGFIGLENQLYQNICEIFLNENNVKQIKEGFPKLNIPRRNTGYALDMLIRMQPFNPEGKPFNFCSLIAGSEGTLVFVTAAKLKLTKIPQGYKRLVCIHCKTIDDALKANVVALNYHPYACELIDHYILEATTRNKEHMANRFFVEGDPKAILIVELIGKTEKEVDIRILNFLTELGKQRLGYAFPIVKGDKDMGKVWSLRKAGLGLLSNIPGDTKPVPVVEDTAVDVKNLPDYIQDFNKILKKYNLYSVHYAHAGSGELHLRPYLNLKTKEGVKLFRTIAEEIADLVKTYNGSLSGEHGDGRLRGEFIPKMIGTENYQLLKKVKQAWDPHNIFNPGKIIDTAPMDTSLRYEKNHVTPEYTTMLDFSKDQGFVRATELCNGSGDCRKSELTDGIMCPSYQATRNEKDTTRARANILREMLTKQVDTNPFAQGEISEIMDLCLSCKGCKNECPSNVDIAKLKMEWQYQSMKEKGVPFRVRMIANYAKNMKRFEKAPWIFNLIRTLSKPVLGFASERSIPKMAPQTLRFWFEKEFHSLHRKSKKTIYFFFDEYINYLDVEIGKKVIMLLDRMGYEVKAVNHQISGRSYLSTGMLEEAKELAQYNVTLFHSFLKENMCLVGIEPSAILTFRDEYPDLLRGEDKKKALSVAEKVCTIEEFLAKELDAGNLSSSDFSREKKNVMVHGHCHQKVLSSMIPTMKVLKSAKNFKVQMIPSGCCGMAGSFGYEKEHYDISMKIGELVLFPKIREADDDVIILASGTSCRHQIFDGTGRVAKHLVEIL